MRNKLNQLDAWWNKSKAAIQEKIIHFVRWRNRKKPLEQWELIFKFSCNFNKGISGEVTWNVDAPNYHTGKVAAIDALRQLNPGFEFKIHQAKQLN